MAASTASAASAEGVEPPSDDEKWSNDVRARLLTKVPGPCVLDVSVESILSYAQGDWSLVQRDFAEVYSLELAEKLCSYIRDDVRNALAVRRELVNYKKVCLHMWQAALAVERDLRQLSSFFFCSVLDQEADPERKKRYFQVSGAMNECSGVVKALWDARFFSKLICNLPRHPDCGIPKRLEDLPESLEISKDFGRARCFLESYDDIDRYYAARWAAEPANAEPAATGSEASASASGAQASASTVDEDDLSMPAKPARGPPRAWKSERERVTSAVVQSILGKLFEPAQSCSEMKACQKIYYEQVLVARGAYKACAISWALRRYCDALRSGSEEAAELVKALQPLTEEPSSASAAAAGLHLVSAKHYHSMLAISQVSSAMLRWLDCIAAAKYGDDRLFVSGARGAAAFVPRAFPEFLVPFREVVREHRPTMLAELSEKGWPRSARPPDAGAPGRAQQCGGCGERHTLLWVHRGVCFRCELGMRSEGRCPYGSKCGRAAFCPHDQRCIVCEQWSCEKCQLLRGDGEDVWQLVGRLQPGAVFLDFDRTLCTTKAGASPLIGTHSVDADLAAVCAAHANVSIVTRSSRKADIEQFLAQKGVPIKQVLSLKHEQLPDKGTAIRRELEKLETSEVSPVGIFVDDDIKELTAPALAELVAAGRLHRMLFVRAGGKE